MDPTKLFETGDLSDLTLKLLVAGPAAAALPFFSSFAAAAAKEGVEEEDGDRDEEEVGDPSRPVKRVRFSSEEGGSGGVATAAAAISSSSSAKEMAEEEAKEGEKEEEAAAVVPTVHTVRAHTFPLVSTSTYFAAAMTKGQWMESQDRVVEIPLADEQALADFKTLIRQAYSKQFVLLGEEVGLSSFSSTRLPAPEAKASLIRRLVMADQYGFEGAVAACAMALGRWADGGLSFEEAAAAFGVIPEPLLAQPALDDLVRRLGIILAKGPNESKKREEGSDPAKKKRGRTLQTARKTVGSEHGYTLSLKLPGSTGTGTSSTSTFPLSRAIHHAGDDCWLMSYKPRVADFLDGRVKALPLPALEALLKSADEARALPLSEDRYWIAHGWIDHQERRGGVFHTAQDARDAFARLLKALPLERMHRRFISDVVMRAADLQALGPEGWGIMATVVANAAFAHRPESPPSYSYRASRSAPPSSTLFGKPIEADMRFPAAACRGLANGASRHAALLLGVPLVFKLCKGFSGAVNLAWGLALPDRQVARPPASECAADSLVVSGPITFLGEAAATRAVLRPMQQLLVPGALLLETTRDVMGAPWDEVFKEGSEYLNAKDELVLHVRVAMDADASGGATAGRPSFQRHRQEQDKVGQPSYESDSE